MREQGNLDFLLFTFYFSLKSCIFATKSKSFRDYGTTKDFANWHTEL